MATALSLHFKPTPVWPGAPHGRGTVALPQGVRELGYCRSGQRRRSTSLRSLRSHTADAPAKSHPLHETDFSGFAGLSPEPGWVPSSGSSGFVRTHLEPPGSCSGVIERRYAGRCSALVGPWDGLFSFLVTLLRFCSFLGPHGGVLIIHNHHFCFCLAIFLFPE